MWNSIQKALTLWSRGLFPTALPSSLRTSQEALGKASHKAMLVFAHTGEVIRAETVLRERIAVKVKAPPPSMHTGCDMVIVFDLQFLMLVKEALRHAGIEPLQIVPLTKNAGKAPLLEPVSLYHVRDFGAWLMVRAANMKITVEKSSGRIVNISGGGCPDVPYLAHQLTGKTLEQVATLQLEPRHKGQTLCSYALQMAFEEAGRLLTHTAQKDGTSCGLS